MEGGFALQRVDRQADDIGVARRQVLGYPPRGMEQGKTTDPAAWLAELREQGERDAGNAIMQIQPRAGRPASRRCR